MKITHITPHLLTAKWTGDPWFPQMLHSTAIVRVQTDDPKIDGLGEITLGYFAAESVVPLVEYFKSTLIGQDAMETVRLARSMLGECVWWGRSGAARSVISGIELALWDIKGKALGVPVYQLLGGKVRDRVPVYASGGPTCWPIDQNLAKVEHYLERGYRAVKFSPDFFELKPPSDKHGQGRVDWVKLPFSQAIEQMTRAFERIRGKFPELEMMIDGHQGVERDAIATTEAIQIAAALAPFRLRFYEEPLSYTNLEGYRELKQRSTIPIAVGESFSGLEDFHEFLAAGAMHVAQPDIGFVGGLHETLRIAHHAEAHHATTAIHCGASMGPSLAASWHLAAASPSVQWLEHVPAARLIHQDLLLDDFTITDGCVGVPSLPGLGVRLDPSHLKKFPFVPNSGERT